MVVRTSRGRIRDRTWARIEGASRDADDRLDPAGRRARALVGGSEGLGRASISICHDGTGAAGTTSHVKDVIRKLQAFAGHSGKLGWAGA
jgi:hypothetical protein